MGQFMTPEDQSRGLGTPKHRVVFRICGEGTTKIFNLVQVLYGQGKVSFGLSRLQPGDR